MDSPKVHMLNIRSDIKSRYARTLVTSKLTNPANESREVAFEFTIPETAFVSKFLMEVDGKIQEGLVKEREQAKQAYDAAVQSGKTAGHVATASVRDSSQVRISVNVGAHGNASFYLTYEELLTRRKARYELVINLSPGQVVPELQIEAHIQETRNLTKLQVPPFRASSEIDFEEADVENTDARIERVSEREAVVRYTPSAEQQRKIGGEQGLQGKFVLRYDVQRRDDAGEVLAMDGYFVHFFCPPVVKALPKHVIFVLDVSGSMQGRKLQQLQDAMNHILGELGPGDFFNILEFSYGVTITDVVLRSNSLVLKTSSDVPLTWYNPEAQHIKPVELPEKVKAFPATPELIAKARKSVSEMTANGGTNIYDSVKTAVGVAKSAISYDGTPGKLPDPLVIFLTDGDATVGETNRDKILSLITEKTQIPMFTLAFGNDADFPFLKRLSLRTGAFARKIYEASDAALQLRDFYRQIASPLLSNVRFKYSEQQIDQLSVTKNNFNLLFSGTELVVCGKLLDALANLSLNGEVKGMSVSGELKFCLTDSESSDGSSAHASGQDRFLERLWAFLSIRQLLEKFDAERADDETLSESAQVAKKKALELALKYSFVTPVTSLVVVAKDRGEPTENVSFMESSEEMANFTEHTGFAVCPAPPQMAANQSAPSQFASDYAAPSQPRRMMSRISPMPVAPAGGGMMFGAAPPMMMRSLAMPVAPKAMFDSTPVHYDCNPTQQCRKMDNSQQEDSFAPPMLEKAEPDPVPQPLRFAYVINASTNGKSEADARELEATLRQTLGFYVVSETCSDVATLLSSKIAAICSASEVPEDCVMLCVLYDTTSGINSEQIWKMLQSCSHLAGKPKILLFLEYGRTKELAENFMEFPQENSDFFFMFGFEEGYVSHWCCSVEQNAGRFDLDTMVSMTNATFDFTEAEPLFRNTLSQQMRFAKFLPVQQQEYEMRVAERRSKI